MNTEKEIQAYRNTLENGMNVICEAMGVSTERYDTDQADFACYEDFFKEVASLIKKSGWKFDEDIGEWKQSKVD